jgi:hypothetical protein
LTKIETQKCNISLTITSTYNSYLVRVRMTTEPSSRLNKIAIVYNTKSRSTPALLEFSNRGEVLVETFGIIDHHVLKNTNYCVSNILADALEM